MSTKREVVVGKADLLVTCPICAKRVRAASIRAHLKGLHPKLQATVHRAILSMYEPRNSLVPKSAAKSTKLQTVKKVARKVAATIVCRVCGRSVRMDGVRQHRVKFHGANPRVLGARVTKKDAAPFVVTNIGKPWYGGAPGTGRRS